jgi:hypothetical protein
MTDWELGLLSEADTHEKNAIPGVGEGSRAFSAGILRRRLRMTD